MSDWTNHDSLVQLKSTIILTYSFLLRISVAMHLLAGTIDTALNSIVTCGYEMNADLNAANNIEHRARDFRYTLESQGCQSITHTHEII